jgi:hypothetical protein
MANKLVLDKTAIRTYVNDVTRGVTRQITRKVLTRSSVLCPVDTGRLRASGRMKVDEGPRGPRGIVEYPVRYAAAVHDGHGPQVIRAKKKKALAFTYQGKRVVVKSVHTRGTTGRPFLRNAARDVAASEGYRFIPRK